MQDILKKAVKNAAAAIGIHTEDLKAFFKRGETVIYKAGDWAFHESTPRQWAGIVLDGEVEIVRGLHGSTARVAVLRTGALISESALLDDLPHSTSAAVRHGAMIWQISRSQLDEFREKKPEVFYRIVARVAKRISERLRISAQRPADDSKTVGGVRREHDSLGERELPDHAYYGVQTARALENFQISGVPLRNAVNTRFSSRCPELTRIPELTDVTREWSIQ